MKGIILSGGLGTRLNPITTSCSKQLLPIFDKPMIYYSLTTLINLDIKDLLIISNEEYLDSYYKLLNKFHDIGLKFSFMVQPEPRGIAEAFLIGKDFIGENNVTLILGDNIFFSNSLYESGKKKLVKGARIFSTKVENPNLYGVCQFKKEKLVKIIEKPKKFISRYVVTGIYSYKNKVVNLVKNIKPSNRNELEITDLNNLYFNNDDIECIKLENSSIWLDAGSPDSLLEASNFVKSFQSRSNEFIGSPESAILSQGYATKKEINNFVNDYPASMYKDNLIKYLNLK